MSAASTSRVKVHEVWPCFPALCRDGVETDANWLLLGLHLGLHGPAASQASLQLADGRLLVVVSHHLTSVAVSVLVPRVSEDTRRWMGPRRLQWDRLLLHRTGSDLALQQGRGRRRCERADTQTDGIAVPQARHSRKHILKSRASDPCRARRRHVFPGTHGREPRLSAVNLDPPLLAPRACRARSPITEEPSRHTGPADAGRRAVHSPPGPAAGATRPGGKEGLRAGRGRRGAAGRGLSDAP